jgi:hypothetical protein
VNFWRRRLSPRGWVGALLCVLALLAVTAPAIGYARALNSSSISLPSGPQHLRLPADRTYGIYVDDANNSGYSESCSAVDAHGQQIQMNDPPWTVTASDTETLDFVYDTSSGDVTIDCSVPGERVTTRQVPNNRTMLLGIILAGILGFTGVRIMVTSLRSGSAPAVTAVVHH